MNAPLSTSVANSVSKSIASDVALFGGGCFWCLDAVFRELKGVTAVAAGRAHLRRSPGAGIPGHSA